jgi:hypothetical protein
MGGPKRGTVYPDRWIAGPDPVRHKQYLVWLQQKNQANFRGEQWDLDFDTWLELWGDLWQFRGRSRDCYCMTRRDPSGPWSLDNVMIIGRSEHVRNSNKLKFSK